MAKTDIITKALKCIDEAYPAVESSHGGYFPVNAFIDEAVRFVVDSVPCHTLGKGDDFEIVDEKVTYNDDAVSIALDRPFEGRIVYCNVSDWVRPVLGAIADTHPRYLQQSNRVLRGNPSRPVVTLSNGRTMIKLYSTRCQPNKDAQTWDRIIELRYMPYDADKIPSKLIDLTAWKLAEIVLMSMSDVQAASVCTAKVNEHLQQLSL